MIRCVTWLLTVCVLLLTTTTAQAAKGNKPKRDPEAVFKKLDKNGDGKLSLEEFLGKKPADKVAKAENRFKAKDTNGDGFLSLDEFKAHAKRKAK